MKVTYDPEVDIVRILLSTAPIEESDEEKPGVILDYDKDGNIVGLEILDASPIPPSSNSQSEICIPHSDIPHSAFPIPYSSRAPT